MKLPQVRFKIPEMPRPVVISLAVLAVSAILAAILVPVLGGMLDTATAENQRLARSIDQAGRDTKTVDADFRYVTENLEHFEKLIQSNRLVPHTRRDALKQIQSLAQEHGLTALNADFTIIADRNAAPAAQSQNDAFSVSTESIKLKVGSPLDGQIYGFVTDLGHEFPGAAIMLSMKLTRPEKVTEEALRDLNKKGSALVSGDIDLLWRTAQPNDPEKKK